MTSQLPCFWCFFAAVTSLRSFLFRDDFSQITVYNFNIRNTAAIFVFFFSLDALCVLKSLGWSELFRTNFLIRMHLCANSKVS